MFHFIWVTTSKYKFAFNQYIVIKQSHKFTSTIFIVNNAQNIKLVIFLMAQSSVFVHFANLLFSHAWCIVYFFKWNVCIYTRRCDFFSLIYCTTTKDRRYKVFNIDCFFLQKTSAFNLGTFSSSWAPELCRASYIMHLRCIIPGTPRGNSKQIW